MKKSNFLIIAAIINLASAHALGMNPSEGRRGNPDIGAILEHWRQEHIEALRAKAIQKAAAEKEFIEASRARAAAEIGITCAQFISECKLEDKDSVELSPVNDNEGSESLTKLEVMLREMHDQIQAPGTPDIVKIKTKSIINIIESFSQSEVEGLSSQQIKDKVKHIQEAMRTKSHDSGERKRYELSRRGY
jgi:hypothetical protein